MPYRINKSEYNAGNDINTDIPSEKYHPRTIGINELKVEHFMSKNPVMTRSNVNLPGGVDVMTTNNISNLVVVENRKPIGVLTEREVLRYLANYRIIPADRLLKDVALQPFCIMNLKATLLGAAKKMIRKKCRILVSNASSNASAGSTKDLDSKELIVGIITASDMVKAFAQQIDKDPTLRSVMSKRVYFVNLNDTIYDAINIMHMQNIGSVIVVENEKGYWGTRRLYGIFTERDLLTRVLLNDVSIDEPVKDYCSTELLTASMGIRATEAAKIMSLRNIKRLPLITEVPTTRRLGGKRKSTSDETIRIDDRRNLEAIITARDLVDLFQNNN
ncbi:MAG TPA: CBS domain-containing protein [Nitrososphaeraceae archaeon]|jgi:CBS domain-containing protein|nr:CBS domain-containing protein [Nitrososphaeraceae archaeon]